MNIFKNLFIKIGSLMGLELQQKDLTTKTEEYPITRTISNKLSTLTLMDSDISIVGVNKRATYLQEILQSYIYERIEVACEIALLTGDCLLKPYTDGNNIGIDIIKNNDFVVCESIGNFIKSIIIKCDEVKKGLNTYTRYEVQTLKQVEGVSYLVIKQLAFNNETQVPLSIIDAWANIKEEQIIPNVNQLLIGKIKSPTVNVEGVNSVNGVSVTNSLDKAIKYVIDSYNRFNQEFEDKETMIFANKTLFKKNEQDGSVSLPKGKNRLFYWLKGTGENNLIDTFSPDIRVDALERGLELNLKMLEMLCGLSAGILTAPHTNFATATEMRASLQSTFAFMTRFRHNIELGIQQLFYGINILVNVNNIAPTGEFEITFDWSSSYIEQLTEQFNRLMQGETIGVVKPEEVRAFIFDEDIETAKQNIYEIKASEPQAIDDM
ncbi:phage portal protein [[Clostridium] colinum]|uniref:phage portal protein n=1 Tax=[Clostridium] colinum TaxID=36835 RepID=UPI0020250E72|nr:phage portal protein [[Clostridium] colinum]